jgi:TRAP-type C4-dicarboxylate transport system substrate-binding protein
MLYRLIFAAVLIIALVAGPLPASAEKPIKLLLATFENPTMSGAITLTQLGKDLEAVFPGRVEVEVQTGGTLGKAQEYYDLAAKGIADITTHNVPFTPGRFPVMELAGMPIQAPSALVVGYAFAKLHDMGYLDKEFSDVKLLTPGINEPMDFLCVREPFTTLKDLKGKKIRSGGGTMTDVLKALGATPISLPLTEVYGAMEKGVIDAAFLSWNVLKSVKLFEVTKHITYFHTCFFPFVMVMNKAKWEALPADIKHYLETTSTRYAMSWAAETIRSSRESLELADQVHIPVHHFSPAELDKMRPLLAPIWEPYFNKYEARGFPVRKASEAFSSLLKLEFGVENPFFK